MCTAAVLAAPCALAQSSDAYQLGQITRTQFNVPELPIYVTSENAEVLAAARRAFEVHGAFKLATQAQAKYSLALTPDVGGMHLKLTGGAAPLSTNVQGPDLRRSALRACDKAVSHILGIPGFFDSKIAYVSDLSGNREIYAGDLLFNNVRRLTSDKSNSLYPRWSPDGAKLLYTGYFNTGFPDIFLLDFASSKRSTVASYKGTNTGAVFSPNGHYVAMALSSSGNPEIYIAGHDGKNPKRLTRTKALESSPVFSPDSSRLCFVNDSAGGPQLYEMNIDGSNMRRITRGVSGHCTEPAWNPKRPNLIAFTAAYGRGFQIALLDNSTGTAQALTAGPGDGIEACWLNDGRHVVYTQRQGKQSKLRIFDTLSGRSADLHSARVGNTSQADALYQGGQ